MPGSRMQRRTVALGILFFAAFGLLLAQKNQQHQAGTTNSTTAPHASRMPRFSTVSGRKFFGDPDAGELWKSLASGRMFFNSYDQATIIRYDGNRVERSEDSGASFEAITAPFEDIRGARFYFVSADSQQLFAQSAKGVLAWSRDSGDTWTAISAPESHDSDSQAPFSVLSNGETRLLWGGRDGLFVAMMQENQGGSLEWSHIADLGPITAITTAPLNDAVAVGTADGHTLVNYDVENLDAASWISSHPRAAAVSAVEFDAEDSERLVAGYGAVKSSPSEGVLYYTQDGGRSWQAGDGSGYAALPDSPVLAALFLPTDDGTMLYVVTRAGVFVSSDFVSWALEAGLPGDLSADSIALSRKKDSAMLVVQSSELALAASLKATVKCTFAVSPTKKEIGAKGGKVEFKVNANSSTCAWSVTKPSSSAPWKIASGQNGRGDGEATISVNENTTSKSRSMNITIAGKRVTITQAGAVQQTPPCDPQLTESLSGTFPAEGQRILLHVKAAPGCRWSFSVIPVSSLYFEPPQGSGNATVGLLIPSNTGALPRKSEIKFAGRTIVFNQNASTPGGGGAGTSPNPGPCTITATPTSFTGSGGKGTLKVTKTSKCGTITLKSTATWLSLSQSQVTATGDVTFNVPEGPTRSADITITTASGSVSGGPFKVTQTATSTTPPAACTALRGVLSPDTLLATAGKSQLTIQPTGNCTSITATSDQAWLSLKITGTNGEAFATANTSAVARTAKITLRSGSITSSVSITQAGQTTAPAVCTITLDKTSIQFGKTSSSMPIAVRANRTDCPWSVGSVNTATTPSTWVRVSPTSGVGSGTVNVSVDAASIQGRQATFTIAGVTVTVKQDGTIGVPGGSCQCVGPACGANMQMSVSPGSFPKAGGSGTITVNAPNSCQWTIDAAPSWIKYTNGNRGTGNGSIRFTVEPNNSGVSRQVTIRSPQATPAVNGSVAQVTISQAR
jgi:hypothetical protein